MKRRAVLKKFCAGPLVSTLSGSDYSTAAGRPVELEVIVSSLDDALAAYQGGASRFEVALRMDQGGLTPPAALVEEILKRIPVPARIMLREGSGFTLSGPAELEVLRKKARELANLPIDGLITGYDRRGELDLAPLRQIAEAVPTTKFTVHNAIEMAENPLDALRALRNLSFVDGALITGGGGTLSQRMARIPAYQEALGRNKSLILGGLHLGDVAEARRSTDVRTFHLGIGVRSPETGLGVVDVAKVREARRLLSQVDKPF